MRTTQLGITSPSVFCTRLINSFIPEQNLQHLTNVIFKMTFLFENMWILIWVYLSFTDSLQFYSYLQLSCTVKCRFNVVEYYMILPTRLQWLKQNIYHSFNSKDTPDIKVHGANMGPNLGPVGPRWAPCWPHEPCYQGPHSLPSKVNYGVSSMRRLKKNDYRKTSNISRTLVGNKTVDNSDVVGASPVGAAPTTSSFST